MDLAVRPFLAIGRILRLRTVVRLFLSIGRNLRSRTEVSSSESESEESSSESERQKNELEHAVINDQHPRSLARAFTVYTHKVSR